MQVVGGYVGVLRKWHLQTQAQYVVGVVPVAQAESGNPLGVVVLDILVRGIHIETSPPWNEDVQLGQHGLAVETESSSIGTLPGRLPDHTQRDEIVGSLYTKTCTYVLRVCACRMCFASGVFVLRALCMWNVSCVACAAFVLHVC